VEEISFDYTTYSSMGFIVQKKPEMGGRAIQLRLPAR
jgi:hypothetical protein